MNEMEIEYSDESPQQDGNGRGLKRTWPEINEVEDVRREKLTRSIGRHKLTIHCIRADTYAYSVLKKDAAVPQVPAKKLRLTSDEAERVIHTSTF